LTIDVEIFVSRCVRVVRIKTAPYEQAKSEADKIGLGEVLPHDSCKPGTPEIRETGGRLFHFNIKRCKNIAGQRQFLFPIALTPGEKSDADGCC
jgi:hypothetical protein